MKCPVCDIELKIADRQGVEIDYCSKCRGVWLDRGELDKIIEKSTTVFEDKREGYFEDRDPRQQRRRKFLGDFFDFG